MVTPAEGAAGHRPTPVREGDDAFVEMAADLGTRFAPRAADHDRENRFVRENFDDLREAGYTRLAVPAELGGLGASLRQVCYAQAELAKHCASTALAVNMHLYITLANAYSWRRGASAPEGLLRRVATEGLILMTSGASDGIWPTARAEKVNGGYRISGRKTFCSQAPVADLLTTSAVYEDPDEGPVVLAVAIPTTSEGLEVVETWDTLGMRATASHDVQLNGVLVKDAQVSARRPVGRIDATLRNALVHFSPPVGAVYYGVAAAAYDRAVAAVAQRRGGDGTPLSHDPMVQRQVGLMRCRLQTAWWSLLGGLDELGDDYTLDDRAVAAVQVAKREVVLAAQEVVDTAMDIAGGASFFRQSPLERAYRDVRGGKYHALAPEKVLLFAGRCALGVPADTIW